MSKEKKVEKRKKAIVVGGVLLGVTGLIFFGVKQYRSSKVFKEQIYEGLKEAQRIVWRGDDQIEQDDLFELQDKIAETVLDISKNLKRDSELPAEWPWIYTE